jgi:hypothetical protein
MCSTDRGFPGRDVFGVGAEQVLQRLLKAVADPERPDREPIFPGSALPGALTGPDNPEPQFPGGIPRLALMIHAVGGLAWDSG